MSAVAALLWRLVFWWKRRTGWVLLERGVEAVGRVIRVEPPSPDGDGNFDVLLDEGQDHLVTGLGGRLTCAPPVVVPSLHCEVVPWGDAGVFEQYRELRVGDRVSVVGDHGFDGVHTGRSTWLEVPLALWRHQASWRTGWFELHPVTHIRVLIRAEIS